MAELERELRELGRALELPPTPDLVPAVRARLAAARRPRAFTRRRRGLVLALAALALAIAGAMAVPQARTAILEWLGLRGVTIQRVETAPTATRSIDEADLALGERVTLAEARRRGGYPIAIPRDSGLDAPDAVHVDDGGRVSLVYRDHAGRIEALLTQFRAGLDDELIHKSVGPGTTVEPARVGGSRGWWIEGEPHEVVLLRDGEPLFETLRLAANTLLWERGDVTLRIEGDLTKSEAIRIAESVG